MGTKRVGLARTQALIQNLKRELTLGGDTLLVGQRIKVTEVTADTSLTAADSGKIIVFADAAATITLPDSGNGDIIGCTFTFVSHHQGTGQKVVCTDTTNEKIIGSVSAVDNDGATDIRGWPALGASNFSSVNMNSVAQGHPGSMFKLTCIKADRWLVEGQMIQSGGSEATPFATS